MPEDTTLTVEERPGRTTGSARRLRLAGKLPAVVYGGQEEPVAVSVDIGSVQTVLRSESGTNTLLTLKFADSDRTCKALIREVQTEPIHDQLLHADFIRISMTQEIHVPVHLEFVGTPAGVKSQGGMLQVRRHEVDVACLPSDIPERIEVDVSALEIGDEIRSGDLVLPERVELHSDVARLVVHVVPPTRVVAAEEEAAEEAAAAEAAEGAPEETAPGEGEGEEGSEG